MYKVTIFDTNSDLIDVLKQAKEQANSEQYIEVHTNSGVFNVFDDKTAENEKLPELFGIKGIVGTPLLDGYIDEVLVNTENGRLKVTTKRPGNFSVFIDNNDDFSDEIRIENITDTDFEIVVYDADGFTELNQTKNCKENPVKVSYIVVYKG